MAENTEMKLSYESDGKMDKKSKSNKSIPKQKHEKKEFFNTTQNSE